MKKMKVFFFALVTLMVLGLTGCGGTSIDLMDYVTVTFSGVDGQGTAVCNVDMAKLEQDLSGDKDGEISQEELEQLAWIAQFELTVSYQLDKETGLSNGDQVTVSATCDEDFAKDNKVKVSEGKKEFKVEGLKDPVEVDAFASDIFDTDTGVTLEYYGTSPSANLSIRNTCTQEPESLITYKVDKAADLKNGDKITVTAELSAQAAEKGYVLKETEKTITVEGLDACVESFSQLNETAKSQLMDKLKKVFESAEAKGIRFYDSQGTSLTMSAKGTTFSNLVWADEVYEVGYKAYTVIPFTVDIKGSYTWWGSEYHENQVEKSFTGASGYVAVRGLTVDADGNLVDADSLYYTVEGIYQDKAQMEIAIKEAFDV